MCKAYVDRHRMAALVINHSVSIIAISPAACSGSTMASSVSGLLTHAISWRRRTFLFVGGETSLFNLTPSRRLISL